MWIRWPVRGCYTKVRCERSSFRCVLIVLATWLAPRVRYKNIDLHYRPISGFDDQPHPSCRPGPVIGSSFSILVFSSCIKGIIVCIYGSSPINGLGGCASRENVCAIASKLHVHHTLSGLDGMRSYRWKWSTFIIKPMRRLYQVRKPPFTRARFRTNVILRTFCNRRRRYVMSAV